MNLLKQSSADRFQDCFEESPTFSTLLAEMSVFLLLPSVAQRSSGVIMGHIILYAFHMLFYTCR